MLTCGTHVDNKFTSCLTTTKRTCYIALNVVCLGRTVSAGILSNTDDGVRKHKTPKSKQSFKTRRKKSMRETSSSHSFQYVMGIKSSHISNRRPYLNGFNKLPIVGIYHFNYSTMWISDTMSARGFRALKKY